jgi:hypothetical protein
VKGIVVDYTKIGKLNLTSSSKTMGWLMKPTTSRLFFRLNRLSIFFLIEIINSKKKN